MTDRADSGGARVVAFVDIGTNSVRLLVVGIEANGARTTITQQKEVVRLGEGAFVDRRLQPEAMDRAVLVCRHFADLSRSYGADPIVAAATSATRDARNQAEFVERLRREAGLEVRVVSGKEEARLIYLGVTRNLDLQGRTAVFIDIGGGSTEIIVGDQDEHLFLDSLSLGAIRVTGAFADSIDVTRPVSTAQYKAMREHVRYAASHTVHRARSYRTEAAYGTSGTILNLAALASRTGERPGRVADGPLTYPDLKRVAALLCSLPLESRRALPGINPERADIIIAGAAILQTLMRELGVKQIVPLAESGLREGLLADYIEREDSLSLGLELPVRERSVIQLGRACRFDEAHAYTVAGLAEELFESARDIGLHQLDDHARDLLRYAALLHDIGTFLSYSNHHRHTYYLIQNADLLGFDQADKATVAAIAFFHRKGLPGGRHPESAGLEAGVRTLVKYTSAFLRLAESLDRSHTAVVRHARLLPGPGEDLTLELDTAGDAQLEVWGLENRGKAAEKALGHRIRVKVLRGG